MKPDISIFGAAHRPQNWMEVYQGIGENEVSWDMVFVGPNPPICTMPDNFSFIQTAVKPAQCVEIGARATTADLIMNLPDDVLFRTEHPLDVLYQTFQEQKNERVMVSCRFMLYGEDCSRHPTLPCHHVFVTDPSTPVLGLSCLMSRKFYFDLGGLDRKFIAVSWDHDLYMRVHACGGDVILSEVMLDEVEAMAHGSFVALDNWQHDRKKLFEGMWTIPGTQTVIFDRRLPFEPFSDERILEESQGPKGKWA